METTNNIMIVSVISGVLSVIIYLIHTKLAKKPINQINFIKMMGFGVCLGIFNTVLFDYLGENKVNLEQVFMTGQPTF